VDLPRGSISALEVEGFAGAGITFLAVVVLAEFFLGAVGVIFLASFTGEVDLGALDDLLGSGAAFLVEAGFLTGDTARWLALGDGYFLAGEVSLIGLPASLTGDALLSPLLGELRAIWEALGVGLGARIGLALKNSMGATTGSSATSSSSSFSSSGVNGTSTT